MGHIIKTDEQVMRALWEVRNEFAALFSADLLPHVWNETYFAGGCVVDLLHGKEPQDYDIFVRTEQSVVEIRNWLEGPAYLKTPAGYEIRAVTENAVTVRMPSGKIAQVVTRWYGDTERVFRTFDFEHCKSYYDPSNAVLHYNREVIDEKKLLYTGEKAEYTLNTLKRLAKFAARGWTPDNQSVIALHRAIHLEDVNDPVVFRTSSVGFYGSSFK